MRKYYKKERNNTQPKYRRRLILWDDKLRKGGVSFITKKLLIFFLFPDVGFAKTNKSPSWQIPYNSLTNPIFSSVCKFIFQILTILIKSKQCLNLTAVTTFVIISAGFSMVRIFWIMTLSSFRISRTK